MSHKSFHPTRVSPTRGVLKSILLFGECGFFVQSMSAKRFSGGGKRVLRLVSCASNLATLGHKEQLLVNTGPRNAFQGDTNH